MSLQRLKPENLKPGSIRHEQLPASLIARIEAVCSTLADVYPMSMAKWLDGFQRDAHPEQEVLWWEWLARCYVEYRSRKDLNAKHSKAAFKVIFGLLSGLRATDLASDLASLPDGALGDIAAIMRSSTVQ